MPFLPEGYEGVPSNSSYMKLQEGVNTIRILSSAVVGYEYWNVQNQPVRSKLPWPVLPDDCKLNDRGQKKMNHFWAFMVYNYEDKKVMLLELTQKTIQEAIEGLVNNPRWGDPKTYDIQITRIEANGKTSYNTQAMPPIGPADPAILEAYSKMTVRLEALFTGDDPFAATGMKLEKPTPAEIVAEASGGKFVPQVVKPLSDMNDNDPTSWK